MDETKRRSMHDQHMQDEARARQAQHLAAGDVRVVRQLPTHGDASTLPREDASADVLVSGYNDAVTREREAWIRVRGLPGHDGHSEPEWNAWRSTVEARDRATRLLINHALGAE